ncbi:MaoC family dehydratase [Halalkalicoccus ordinarius]|uniref:MaoC family dehydratase n=1 Tax=Halalkalicoccus ordinarius TaxID=3116651 RepID=UPI00300EF523
MSESESPSDETPMTEFVDSWSDASKHVINSYFEANKAILAGMGLAGPEGNDEEQVQVEPPIKELSYGSVGWSMDRSADTREELGVGEYVEFTKLMTDADVHAFAQASGDTNRLHLDDEYAGRSRFGSRIVHGTLVGGLISAALARLPGLTIYLSESLEFKGPAMIGSVLTARCEIVEDLGDDRYRLTATVTDDDGNQLIDGEAVVLIDDLPE